MILRSVKSKTLPSAIQQKDLQGFRNLEGLCYPPREAAIRHLPIIPKPLFLPHVRFVVVACLFPEAEFVFRHKL